jgi:hypothetical protein
MTGALHGFGAHRKSIIEVSGLPNGCPQLYQIIPNFAMLARLVSVKKARHETEMINAGGKNGH